MTRWLNDVSLVRRRSTEKLKKRLCRIIEAKVEIVTAIELQHRLGNSRQKMGYIDFRSYFEINSSLIKNAHSQSWLNSQYDAAQSSAPAEAQECHRIAVYI